MSAFQPILTCFLCLVIANIAVRGMTVINKRRYMCLNEATTSKFYMTVLLKKWDKEKRESTCLSINHSQVRQHFVFVLIAFLFLFLSKVKRSGSNIKSKFYYTRCITLKHLASWWGPSSRHCACGQHSSFRR